ncbi:ATP-binding protein [Agromyces larvae]|uniref:ATP-binding protein n=1 Tax=Agromyces larvae TaxID=2929802 RepID=A0ABY4BVW1_9MICO|nr:ATP-binding protein [Agromyces larvae]UOE42884.1 ATP-binding protein [Agromyces larvae]
MASVVPSSPIGRILPRHAHRAVEDALADTRVVLINGARQCGKSTIVAQIGADRGAEWRSLDRAATRHAAEFDPTSFVRDDQMLVIDEVQRVPELLLAIKEVVDTDPRPGRFLLTGSARVLGLRGVPDALPGRMETIELWPLAQGEIDGTPDGFVDAVFDQGVDLRHGSLEQRTGYIDRVIRGGFPEAVARVGRRRETFFDNYVADIVNRDVIQLSEIERGPEMRALIRMLAARSGQLLVPGSIAGEIGLPQTTVNRYLGLLEEVFLIKRIPAWSRNLSSRAVSTAKAAMVDSGIAANLLGQDAASLRRIDSPLGGLLEGFVTMEIARQLTWSNVRAELFHYRTKDKVEVDIVLEDRRGRVVAIDVKSSATARPDDFKGINHLAERVGGDLVAGIVLYTGTETLAFGPKNRAVPISALWEM